MKKSLIFIALLLFIMSFKFDTGDQEIKTKRRVITFDNKPAKRPYSLAIEVNNTLYVSGQIALDQATGKLIEGKIEEQTRQVLKNLKNVVEKAGYSMENVARCTVLMTDISFYSTVNQIYMGYFPKDPPARMAFAVKDLPMGALIEIDATAVR
jgi:2-iminobutanoate/2-iminopropanoate deaminase